MAKVHHFMLKLVVCVIVSIIMRIEGAVQNDECSRVSRCGEIEIKFPFYLKDRDGQHKEDHCVFPPGFQLSCDGFTARVEFEYEVNTSLPGLYLFLSVKADVGGISSITTLRSFSTTIILVITTTCLVLLSNHLH